ncbi:MAG: peroxiredoxin family protein, partial [Bacteroidota bacterium]
AKVMGEPPQQLDFIFNKEDIVFETDFETPQDSLKVIRSDENRVWFDFLQKEQLLTKELELLEKEVDYYQARVAEARSSGGIATNLQELEQQADQKANAFNQLQMERNMFVEKTVKENQNLFATRLIQTFREPFRDGYLNTGERKKSVQQEYFSYVDFSDESLMNSPVLTDKVFDYLVSYNQPDYSQEQREKAYIKAVDEVMSHVQNENERVAEFILNYLVNGFEGLGMENVLTYIAENYGDNICQTDEKTTLERKLEYQKMKPGTVVPDFTIDNIKGQPLTLSHVLENRNLIVFWASWCPHCVELLPRIKTWFRQFNPGNFEIIAISLDTSEQEWKNAVVEAGFEEFYNLSDLNEWDGEVTENYNVYATPTMFLIDANRKILAKPERFEELLKNVDR